MTEQPRIACGPVSRTYPEFGGRVARMAGGLAALGVVPGDHVAVMLRNGIEFLEVLSGATTLGARPVP